MAIVNNLYRYPVKGLDAEALERVVLEVDRCIPFDRAFAITREATSFDPEAPVFIQKTNFLMQMWHEKMAVFRTRFNEENLGLQISLNGQPMLDICLADTGGIRELELFFDQHMATELGGKAKFVTAINHTFADIPQQCLSIINLNSVRAFAAEIDMEIDPLRFRANVYLEDLDPWVEFDWIGQGLCWGEAELYAGDRIERCAATNVNPINAERDMNIPFLLRKTYGHLDMGVYAKVTRGGLAQVNQTFNAVS